MADLADALRGHQRIGFDTPVFIYRLEATPKFIEPARTALDDLARGFFTGVTSALTVMEITVRPLQLGQPEVAREYEVLLWNYPNLAIVPVDRPVARRAADLRARYRLRPVDALQIATCMEYGVTAFLTNDRDLRRVSDIQVLLLEDFVAP